LNYRTSPYTPFLRRFTDERAHDIADTINLYNRVASAHRASLWARSDAIERASNFIVERVTDVVELPDYVPLGQVFDTCQRQLLALESTIFASPSVDFSKALTLREQVDLSRFLRSQEYFLEHQDRISEQLVMAIGNVSAGIIQALPPLADSAFTVPLISVFPDPGRIVDSIIGTLCTDELADVGLFSAVGEQIYANMCEFSGVPKDGSSKKPLITASDADIAPNELVETYLAGTPFHTLLLTPVPFSLPDEQRFSGHWVIAPPGRGKTTLLHAMVLDDLKREASIIVLDSKGDLIEPIKNLKAIADRLVLIEPDPEFPLALNPLDIPRASIAHTISLLEYVMSSLLEAKMTALQTALFRKLLPAFVEAFPNPTLETFRRVLIDGMAPYRDQLANLSPDAREFFTDAQHGFNSKTYTDTRNQLVWRLDFLLSNPILRAMFASFKTKLDIGKEMDAGKVIIINNSKALLGDEGAEFFGRFFIALILAAAQQRAGRRPEQKRPVYCYIDECHTVIARDPKIATILDECRSQRIALILSHQRSAQLTPGVLDAVVNCGIRFANSDDEAKFLADKLRTTTDFLYGLPRGTFAAFVRDLTPTALALKIPYTDMDKLPKTTAAERQAIRDRMRAQFSFTPQSQAGERSAASRTEPAEPSTTNQPAAPAPRSAPPAVPLSSPHTGDHTEPAAKWGDS
jgi:hypothetical protein